LTETLDFWLLDLWYIPEDGIPVVYLSGFLGSGEKVVLRDSTFKPHFFTDMKTNRGELVRLRENSFKRKPFWKIETQLPYQVPKEAENYVLQGYRVFASDIYFTQVYMKGRGFKPSSWHEIKAKVRNEYEFDGLLNIEFKPKKVETFKEAPPKLKLGSIDIESYNPMGGMPDVEEDPIIVFGIKVGNKKIMFFSTERDRGIPLDAYLLEDARDKIRDLNLDVPFTYNGNDFDWDYITERSDINGVPFDIGLFRTVPRRTEYSTIGISGRPTVDLYGYAPHVGSKRKRLPDVHYWLQKEGILPKRKFKFIDRDRIAEFWDNGQEDEVIEHCESDITFTHDLGEYVLPFALTLSRITNVPLDECLSVPETVLMDSYLYRYADKLGYVIPNRESRKKIGSKGAIVFLPKIGIIKNVGIADFISMYPEVGIKYNISFETFVGDKPTKRKKGMFVVAMEDLLVELVEVKKRFGRKYSAKYAGEVQAVKVLARALSPHGYLGYHRARWYSLKAKEYELRKCRLTILKTAWLLEKAGFSVVYGDTDSVFLENVTKDDMEEACEIVEKEMNLPIDYEIYPKVFFTEAQKRYIYLDSEGKVHFVGFERIRGDWCNLAKKVQGIVATIVLKEENVDKAVRYLRFVLKNIKSFPKEDFMLVKGLGQPVEYYEGKHAHVEVAKRCGTDISGDVVRKKFKESLLQ
jgi:DNA polymerase I